MNSYDMKTRRIQGSAIRAQKAAQRTQQQGATMAKAFTDFTKTTELKAGDVVTVYNSQATVTKILPFGTVQAVTKTGQVVRISGLAF